jgi:hypothetical protein
MIDRGLAAELGAVIGWDSGDGAPALVTALAGSIPVGSTAKLAAVAAGEIPPGADPAAVARRMVDDRVGPRPTVSWSCWAMSSVMAALAEGADLGPVAVAGLRRIDDRAPAVDVHSVVLVDGVVCDPYLAGVVAGPGADETERDHGGVVTTRVDEPDGRWTVAFRTYRWSSGLEYRILAPVLDPADVHALCAVSVTHTGAPPRPMAVLWRDHRGVDLATHAEGGVALRRWRPDRDAEITEHPTWADATAAFAAETGIPLA